MSKGKKKFSKLLMKVLVPSPKQKYDKNVEKIQEATETSRPKSYKQIKYEDLDTENMIKLGSGISSIVYLVYYKGNPYALKQLYIGYESKHRDEIIYEIRGFHASVDSSYIVQCYEIFYNERISFLLEYMDCGSLQDILSIYCTQFQKKVPEKIVSTIACQVILALIHLEEKKVIHRDIKPSNICMNKKGEVKLADFGSSKMLQANEEEVFFSYKGTHTYMSPERIVSKEHSFNSDVWSLSLVILQLLCGKYPFKKFDTSKEFQIGEYKKEGKDAEYPLFYEELEMRKKENDISEDAFRVIKMGLEIDQEKRASAKSLLNERFIQKYNKKSQPNIKMFEQWLKKEYIPKRNKNVEKGMK